MEQVDARHDDPNAVQIHYDYDFHLAIAKATGNEFIHGFLIYLRPMIVPRYQLGYVVASEWEGQLLRAHSQRASRDRRRHRQAGQSRGPPYDAQASGKQSRARSGSGGGRRTIRPDPSRRNWPRPHFSRR